MCALMPSKRCCNTCKRFSALRHVLAAKQQVCRHGRGHTIPLLQNSIPQSVASVAPPIAHRKNGRPRWQVPCCCSSCHSNVGKYIAGRLFFPKHRLGRTFGSIVDSSCASRQKMFDKCLLSGETQTASNFLVAHIPARLRSFHPTAFYPTIALSAALEAARAHFLFFQKQQNRPRCRGVAFAIAHG